MKIDNFLSNLVHRQTERQTNENENIKMFFGEVIIESRTVITLSLQVGLGHRNVMHLM